ncbi:MAG TPA: asparagine synthase (glutamine-hydrolyzing) [Gemmataceae bacterium]|jgi:asparagine synthase (glutamine-hydrolysing)|nr:asparagine synthase (glutamine-hydrolyzing) [Gemmataceae bacterium]
MCGIAGVFDLVGRRSISPNIIQAMADALGHRGPDDEGFWRQPGIALGARRLSIVDLAGGHQPVTNEDGDVAAVLNGELFEHATLRADLEGRGHRFRGRCDTELLPHLWEEYHADMFDRLRGQFALVVWDARQRRLILGRDRFGICPLYWTRQGDWLLFASEIRALFASGMVEARADGRGLQDFFTFFALPGPATCFAGISALLPGHYLEIHGDLGDSRNGTTYLSDRTYWAMDFPDRGHEVAADRNALTEEFASVLHCAVERRLRADVPVVCYLSGGVDSSLIASLAGDVLGKPITSFSVHVRSPAFDESRHVERAARHLGIAPITTQFGPEQLVQTFPELIRAAEGPVIDTACAALLLLARDVHAHGYKVALTGEGADEWLAGYPWFKAHWLLSLLDVVPGVPLSALARRAYTRLMGAPRSTWNHYRRAQRAVGGANAWLDVYSLMTMSRLRFFTPEFQQSLATRCPYDDLGIDHERMRRWHPLNRSICLGGRVMLPGLLLQAKGDRVAMHSAVETRYPFLDEEVFDFLARLPPRYKLHGLQDKVILRRVAARRLPAAIAWRPKAMFRAPTDSFCTAELPPWVDQLLSAESLRKSGYFATEQVHYWRQAFRSLRVGSYQRTFTEMGLVGVLATQLWHHMFLDSGLCDLPSVRMTGAAIPGSEAKVVLAS